jgi:hypothetical protein
MALAVPAAIFTDADSVADRYGDYWNVHSKDINTGAWNYISYVGYTESE